MMDAATRIWTGLDANFSLKVAASRAAKGDVLSSASDAGGERDQVR